MAAIVKVDVTNRLSYLKPILTTWTEFLGQLSMSVPQTKGRYYLESTLVSLLAGSAWANCAQALTEVKIKRTSSTGPDKWGRLDLLMHVAGQRIALEAKLEWGSEFVAKSLSQRLDTTCAELRSVAGSEADVLLGAVFYVPWWNDDQQKAALESKVLNRYDAYTADAKACYYDRQLDYPGAIVLLREGAP